MAHFRIGSTTFIAALFALLLSACTIGLVPAYDAELAEGLSNANKQALLLFAKVEDDTSKGGYAARADDYATVISAFEELQARAGARPIPPLAKRLERTAIFRRTCKSEIDGASCLNTSPASTARALAVLQRLRSEHRSGALKDDVLRIFKGDYQTAIEQALTVESALKR